MTANLWVLNENISKFSLMTKWMPNECQMSLDSAVKDDSHSKGTAQDKSDRSGFIDVH